MYYWCNFSVVSETYGWLHHELIFFRARCKDPDTGKTSSTEEDEDSWDKKFNEDGDPTDAETVRELERALGRIKIMKPNVINYLEFSPTLNAQYEIKDEDGEFIWGKIFGRIYRVGQDILPISKPP